MSKRAYFVVNVDGDPDPVTLPQTDNEVLGKYATMRDLLVEHTGGKASFSIMTSPMYRDRFFKPPFRDFWLQWKQSGGDLVLHPEEDLYRSPSGVRGDPCSYYDTVYMAAIIKTQAALMRDLGLHFDAYRGGSHGFTIPIGRALKSEKIHIDLSCAPRVVWPSRAAGWESAPLSAYYMSWEACDQIAGKAEADPIFEIPLAWDGVGTEPAKDSVVGPNYIINEFSTYSDMCKVWDAVLERSLLTNTRPIVSMVCHTFSMGDAKFRKQLSAVLAYMISTGGTPVTPTEAQRVFDREQGIEISSA